MNGIEIKNLTVDFGDFKVDNINLTFPRGHVTGLVGRNGAGKTTLIKAITRQPQQAKISGSILYNGERFSDNETGILSKVACVYDTPTFNIMLKPKKIVKFYKNVFPDFDVEEYARLMQKFELPENKRVNSYSYGMQRKYCLILALCRKPDILILDEPTSGIDPFDRNEVVSLIQEFMMDENKTVVFSTHITADLDKIADYIVMMEGGKIKLNERKDEMTESYRLIMTSNMTDEMKECAIGVQQSAFGYTFLTRGKTFEGEGVKCKIPTVEEIFVHITGQNFNGGNRDDEVFEGI